MSMISRCHAVITLLALLISSSLAPSASAMTLHGVRSDSLTLFAIAPGTGVMSNEVGFSGGQAQSAVLNISFHPSSGILYGVRSDTLTLFRINPSTGVMSNEVGFSGGVAQSATDLKDFAELQINFASN